MEVLEGLHLFLVVEVGAVMVDREELGTSVAEAVEVYFKTEELEELLEEEVLQEVQLVVQDRLAVLQQAVMEVDRVEELGEQEQ